MPARKRAAEAQKAQAMVERFNASIPVGAEVDFYSVLPAREPPLRTRTRGEAFVGLQGHPGVFLKGVAGYVSCYHVFAPGTAPEETFDA